MKKSCFGSAIFLSKCSSLDLQWGQMGRGFSADDFSVRGHYVSVSEFVISYIFKIMLVCENIKSFLVISLVFVFYVAFVAILVKVRVRNDATIIQRYSCSHAVPKSNFQYLSEKGSVWNVLTTAEIKSVIDWLQLSGLDLKPFDDAGIGDNYIMRISLESPSKREMLEYLDNNGSRPPRRARVIVSLGARSPPVIREYIVGPIPISHLTEMKPYSFSGIIDIPFNARISDSKHYFHLNVLVQRVVVQISDILLDTYGTSYYPEGECPLEHYPCLTYSENTPHGPSRDVTIWFLFNTEGLYPYSVGLEMSFRMSGVDPASYSFLQLTYNAQTFDSIADFRNAYFEQGGSLIKISLRPLLESLLSSKYGILFGSLRKAPNADGIHDSRSAATRLNSDLIAPEIYEPGDVMYSKCLCALKIKF